MHDDIVAWLRDSPHGRDSCAIAVRFLRFTNPPEALARTAVSAVLMGESRCRLSPDGQWRYHGDHAPSGRALNPGDLLALYPGDEGPPPAGSCALPQSSGEPSGVRTAAQAAPLRQGFPLPLPYLFTGSWEGEALPGNPLVVLPDAAAYRILVRRCMLLACAPPHPVLLCGPLMHLAGFEPPDPFCVSSGYRVIMDKWGADTNPAARARTLRDLGSELVRSCARQGVHTVNQVLEREQLLLDGFSFSGRGFDARTLRAAPQGWGVYGLRDAAGSFLFIGCSPDLRTTLCRHFLPEADPSPEGVQLRSTTAEVTLHPCRNDLEALLFERGLVHKYHPPLSPWNEVPYDTAAVAPQGVIFDPRTRMSLLVRRGAPPRLLWLDDASFDNGTVARELQRFLLSSPAPAAYPHDPVIHCALTCWIERHRPHLFIIPPEELGSGEEGAALLRACAGRHDNRSS